MPQQISKCIGVMLIDEEVEAWQALEAYALKKKLVVSSRSDVKKVGARQLVRVLLRLVAEHLAAEIDPEIAKKLAFPPTNRGPGPGRPRRTSVPGTAKPGAKARGRPPAKKPDPQPTHRIVWDRPWKPRPGDAE